MSATSLSLTPEVQTYLEGVLPELHPTLAKLRVETANIPSGGMQISAEQGHFMSLLIKLTGAKRCLEVGTFTGYSALIVAMAIPEDGRLIACDVSEEWTAMGRQAWREAGVYHKIDLRIAPANETLDKLIAGGEDGQFDFAFIDADKPSYDGYYERVLKLLRPGGLLGIDNTLWSGKVADPTVDDEDTVALRALNEKLKSDSRIDLAVVPIGDGLTLARKR